MRKKRLTKRALSLVLALALMITSMTAGLSVLAVEVREARAASTLAYDPSSFGEQSAQHVADVITAIKDGGFIDNIDILNGTHSTTARNEIGQTIYATSTQGNLYYLYIRDTQDRLFTDAVQSYGGLALQYSLPTGDPAKIAKDYLDGGRAQIPDLVGKNESGIAKVTYDEIYKMLLDFVGAGWGSGFSDGREFMTHVFLMGTDENTAPAQSGKEYLMYYDTVSEIPASIPTMMEFWLKIEDTAGIGTNNQTTGMSMTWAGQWSNGQFSNYVDTTSATQLQAFANVFTADVLSKNYEDLTPAQRLAIFLNGSSVYNTVANGNYADEVLTHFFGEGGFDKAKALIDQSNAEFFSKYVIEPISAANTQYPDVNSMASMDITERQRVQSVLDNFLTYYNGLNGKLSGTQATQLSTAKGWYDRLTSDLSSSAWVPYNTAVYNLGQSIINNNLVQVINGASVDDNLAGVVAQAAQYYVDAVNSLQLFGGYKNWSTIASSVKGSLNKDNPADGGMGTDNYTKYNAGAIVDWISANAQQGNFTVTQNPLLHDWHSVEEIPESFTYKVTVFTYAAAPTVNVSVTENTDTTAKANFTAFQNFYDNIGDFRKMDATQLAELYAQALEANKKIESYTQAQCENILGEDYMAVFNDLSAWMAEIFKTTAEKLYNTYNDKELTREDIAAMADDIFSTEKIYNNLTEEQKQDPDVITAKTHYDEIRAKYDEAVKNFARLDYNAAIQELAELVQKDAVQALTGSAARDNAAGDIKAAADKYLEVAGYCYTMDPATYGNVSAVNAQITQDVQAITGQNVKIADALRYIGSGTFTLTPEYLKDIASVDQIPQSLPYTQYTYTFTDVANPVMTEQAMTDTAASKAFGDYAALFGAAGAQAPTVEELVAYGSDRVIALRDSMQSVKEALANYNTASDIKDRLLGNDTERQERELQTATNIDLAIAQLFVDGVNAAHNTYWNDAQGKYVFVREGVNAAIDEFSALASLYESVSNKSAADVVEAYAKLQAMINALNAFLTEDNLTKFREAVASMADQFFNGTSLKVTIDKSNVTQAQDAVTKVLNAWNALTNDQKNLEEVKAEVTKNYDSASNTWGDLTGGRVKTLQDAINAVTGFDTSAQYPTKPWADIPNISYSLPAGVTESDITNLLSNLDNLLKEDFIKELLGGQTLKEYLLDMIGEQLYTDTILNTLLQTIYPMLHDAILDAYNQNSTVINALLLVNGRERSFQGLQNFLDIHLDPIDLADQTSTASGHAYPEVEAEMRRANLDWNQVNWDNVKWGINGDRNAFVTALGVSLINLFPALKTILLDYAMYSGALTFFNAGNGYDNVIRPLMQHLGCEDIPTADYMNSIASTGGNQAAVSVITHILNPILDRVEAILENPVTELTNLLPLIGYMANNNILQKGLNELIYPITHTGIVGGIIGGSLDVNSMLDLSNLNALIEDLLGTLLGTITAAAASEIGGIEIPAKQVSFTYQPIDWYTLSGLATQNKNVPDPDKKQGAVVGIRMSITADTPKVGAFLLRYLVNTVKANQDLLIHMTGMEEGSAVHNMLSNLFAKDADTIISKLFEVIKNPENSDVDWSQYQNLAGVFDWGTDGLNQDQTDQVIAQLGALLQYVLGNVTGGDVAAFLDGVYTDEMVSQFVTSLYGALGSNSMIPMIFLAMGFSVSKDDVATALADKYPEIAAVINDASDWSQVDLTGADWGINSATGSTTAKADAFMDAISTALKPFNPLLKALLLGGPGGADGIDLLGITTIHGANGYANGIYPLLVALGCDAMTPEEYKTAVEQDESQLISAVVEPVFNKLASLTADPLTVVLDMLPNFANFLANGGLTKALMGFLKPVTNIVTPLLSLVMTNSATADAVSAEQALNWVMGFVLGTDSQPGLIQLPDSVEISEGFSLDLTKLNLTALDFGDLEGSVVTILKSALAGGLLVINGQPFSLTLKDIDWTKLAAANNGENSNGMVSLIGNSAESFVTLLRWLIDTVRIDSNLTSVKTLIMGLIGTQDETVTDILNQVFANLSETNTDLSTDRIIKIIFELLSPQDPADTLDLIYNQLGVSDVNDGEVTFANYEEVITVFDNLINAIMNQVVGSGDLNTMVSGMLYTDANLTAVAQGLYNALGGVSGIDTILNLVGVDVTPAALSTALAAYVGADQIANAASLAEIDWTAVQWNTNGDREAFVSALAAILSPFNAVLKVLLIGEDLNVALEGTDIITIMGGNGYDTAVIPLLEALGCQNIKSEADYIAAVEADDTALLTEIINPVLSLLENVLKSPVDSLATMLPNIAYFLSNGNLSVVVQNLLAPVMKLVELVDPLIDVDALLGQLIGSLIGVEGIDSLFGMLEDIDLASLINPILKNVLPAELQLTLPEIDLAQLAACGTLEEFTSQSTVGVTGDFDVPQYDRANKGQVLKAVFLYIMETAQANKDTITNYINSLLADADQTIKDIANTAVNNLLTGDANQIADALVTLLVLMKENEYTYATYQYDKFTQTTPDYGNLTAEDYEAAIETLDNLVENLLANLMDGQTLEELIGTNVYTNANVNALVGALYPALGNIEGVNLTEIFGYLGMTVDVTPNGLATALGSDYADVAAALTGKASWNDVTVDSLNWNVTDAASFVNALSAALRPFNPLLKVLLMGESITALNSVTIEGSNGYNNAVIPLLEALGCEDLTTAAEIKGSSDPDALLKAILTPIAGLIEKVSAAPVDTVASILPNIAYFIDNGNLETAVRNLAAPVLKIVEVLKPVVDVDALLGQLLPGVVEQNPIVGQILGTTYTVDAILGKLGSLDLDEIGNAVLAGITLPEVNGVQLNLKLADINLSELAGRGTLESYTTAMVAFGDNDPANAKHVVADKASVLSGVATYLVELIRTEPNATTVKNLLTSLIGDVEIVNEIIDRILSEELPAEDLIGLLIVLLSGLDQDDYPYATYQYDKFTQTTPDYGNLTAEDYEAAIETLDNLVENLLANLMDGQTLEELIGTNVYTNANVNALVGALYPALGNIEGVNLTEIFGYLGMTVDVTPNGLATALGSDYADVAAALTGKASWNDVTVDSLNWNVTDAASFVNALSAALRPFNPLLKVLLMGESITALNSVTIEGSNGYNNAVIPLLEALGCEDLTTAAEIKGSSDPDALLKAILTPIAGLIEKVSAAPVDTVASILPNIAYFIDNGNLETAVRNLAAPVLKIVEVLKPVVDVDALLGQLLPGVVEQNPIVGQILGTTYTVDAILGKLGNIDLNQIISVVLANVDLGVTLTLPQISLTQLAGRGTLESYDTAMAAFGDNDPANAKHVVADKASVLSGVATYLVETVSVNRDTISDMLKDLLGDSDLVNSILTQVLDSMENPADLIGALVLILTGRYNVNFYGYSFPNITPAGENFGRFDRETFEQALAAFDPFISTILGGLLGMSGGIGGMINSAIYTNANVTSLVTALYPALENIEGVNLTEIFGYLGLEMDLTPAGFANALGSDYANVTAALNGKTSWADVDLTNVSWGFTDGDATGFVNALSAALRPFNPLLNVLLMDGSLNVMDSVTIQGGNGYNTAVIPLLEALGCENITPAAEVKASSDPDALLKAILTPVTGLVARVGSAPIETLTDILPNIAYFIDNGNLKAALQNLLAPVLALVDVVDPAVLDVNSLVGDLLTPLLTPVLGEGDYTLDGLFDLVGNIGDKLIPLLNQVLTFDINGTQVTLTLKDLDFGKLAAMGTVVDYNSAAVVNGSQMAAKRIDADQPAVLYAVMYYLVDTLKIPENMSAIEGLLGGNEMISGILGSLLGGTNDDAIAVILSLLGIGDDGSQTPTPGGDNGDPSFGDGSEPGFEGGFTPGFDGGFDSNFDLGSGFVDDAFADDETGASTDETTPSDQNGGEDQSGEGDGDNKMSPVVLGVCIGLGILLLLLIISLIIVGVVKKKKKEKENAPQNTETPEQK